MRVIYFASSKGIGFTYHFSDLANILKSKDTLFISGEKEQFPGIFKKLDQAKVQRISINSFDTSKKIIRHAICLAKTIKQFRPEVVHSQTNYQLFLAATLKPFFRYKIIQTIHSFNNGAGGIKQLLTRYYLTFMCLLFANKVIFQSKYVESNFASLKSKSSRLPMGFTGPVKKSPQVLGHSPVIIYAAKFHSAKNHKWLIETLGPLLQKNNWHLILPGDGEQLDVVRALVAKNNLSDWVSMPGWVDRIEIDKLYHQAHLAVIPSKSETLGHNIIEPLAYGIPVISFPVGIAPDIACESLAVTCISYYDAKALIHSIEKKLNTSENYHNHSIAALEYFNKHLTWNAHIIQYKSILNEL
ncbi:Glycosyltransferase Gtf1 [Pseudomonas fluorescens]|nr:Glycosyltransferase Gtf1 [Pseudomonas fluorescens]